MSRFVRALLLSVVVGAVACAPRVETAPQPVSLGSPAFPAQVPRSVGLMFATAAALFLLGVRLATTGKVVFGVPLMTAAALWGLFRLRGRRSKAPPPMPAEEARRLLGLGPDATLADIRAAHRRLIAKVHPDAGGSAELAERVNAARDTLIAEMNRRTPRAS